MQIVIPPFPLRELSIRGLPKGVAAPLSEQQTNISDRNQICFQKCSHEPKRRQVIVCGTQRPSIKSPPSPSPLTQQWKKNKMEKQNVNMPTSNLSVEKFLRLFIYFRTLDFSTIASVSPLRWHLSTTPHFTTSSFDKVLAHTHIIHTYIYTVHS